MDVGADTSWTVVGTVALVCAFVGLFVLDVYRTRKNPDAPMRMLSEIAFNFAMNASIAVMAFAVLRWFAQLVADLYGGRSDPRVALATAVASMGVVAAMYVSGQRGAELPTAPIPDYLRCDGEFVAEKRGGDENPLDAWCGWIRFEGHGMCRVQQAAESTKHVYCEWRVHEENVIRIVLPEPRPVPLAPAELFVRGREVESVTDANLSESVDISLAADGPPVRRFTFIPEEHVNES